MNPAATTNSTNTALAMVRLVDQIPVTDMLPVRSGVARAALPKVSMAGLSAVLAAHTKNRLMAARIWPGMSNMPGASSVPELSLGMPPGGGGPGFGFGVPGGVGDGVPVGGAGIG